MWLRFALFALLFAAHTTCADSLQDTLSSAMRFARKFDAPVRLQARNASALFIISAHLDGNCTRKSLQMSVESIEKFHKDSQIIIVCNTCEKDNPQLKELQRKGHEVIHNDPSVSMFGYELGALQLVVEQDRLSSHDFIVLLQHTAWLVRPIPFQRVNCDITPFYFFWGMSFDEDLQKAVFVEGCTRTRELLAPIYPHVAYGRGCSDPTGGGVFGPNLVLSPRAAAMSSLIPRLGRMPKLLAQSSERLLGVVASWFGCHPSATSIDGEIGDNYPCGFWSEGYCPEQVLQESGVHLGKVWGTLVPEC